MPQRTLRIGTRRSRLALWQTQHVAGLLEAAWNELSCDTIPFVTQGDQTLDRPLPDIGGKGLFTAELEQALLAGEIDLAVHSLKDLPIQNATGVTLGAITARADVRDALVCTDSMWTLATLPHGAAVGTSSLRRRAQLLAVRPDLEIRSIRGNVETRIRKVRAGEYQATLLAAAGLQRLSLQGEASEWLPLDVLLPAPGQAALAVQCRAGDEATLACLAAIDNATTREEVGAERAFLAGLGGGCSAPVAAYAQCVRGDRDIHYRLRGLVADVDGRRILRLEDEGPDGHALGLRLAQQAMTQGAQEMLANG